MAEEIKPTTTQSEAVAQQQACSASCEECDHWEVRVNGAGGEPNLGHCPIFDKLKWYYEGKNCTAFSKPNNAI